MPLPGMLKAHADAWDRFCADNADLTVGVDELLSRMDRVWRDMELPAGHTPATDAGRIRVFYAQRIREALNTALAAMLTSTFDAASMTAQLDIEQKVKMELKRREPVKLVSRTE